MCKISDKIIFCTCETDSDIEVPHYWVLYRFNNKTGPLSVGTLMPPLFLIQDNYEFNKEILAARLNEVDAFDKPMLFKTKDQLEIVINNLSEKREERMVFNFTFKKGNWKEGGVGYFELMDRYDEFAFGNFKNLESVKT